ncbi:MAG TPA: NAD-dependent epimerase/dehydratase family protein [Vicinamibacterales bacterium]|nr:NAD-dependent epimerase/dehydratase family protein [Vicinamibacterales bacterium]
MSEARNRRTVFVTGGAGFIGSALCRRLQSDGHRIVVYDDLSRGRRSLLPPDVALVEGDIRDDARVRAAILAEEPDTVIHLAAMHFIPDCVARPQETEQVNVEGTRRLLDGCRASAVRHFIFASTAAVYAPVDQACLEDKTPLGPLEVYGESKLAGERLVRAFRDDSGISCSILRLFNAIGRNETNPHVLPHVFESLQASDVIRLGNMTPRRDYIDTRDIADAILAVMQTAQGLRVLNVGSGTAHSVSDVIGRLRLILGREITVVPDPDRTRAIDRMRLLADTGRTRDATGWAPRFSLDDTLRDLASAYGLRIDATIRPNTVL